MKRFFSFAAFLFFGLTTFAQNSVNRLTVLPPSIGLWSDGDDAFFESIQLTVTPQTSYAEVVVDLRLSAANSQYSNRSDSLELLYKFMLPSGTIMNGASLWMDGVEVEAVLYEKGEAQVIYESFVIRRTDPLIIYKDGNHYEARIFPLLNPGNRRMQMKLLIPTTQNNKGTFLNLPLEMFEQYRKVQHIRPIVVTLTDTTTWGKPTLNKSAERLLGVEDFSYQLTNEVEKATENQILHFPNSTHENRLNLFTDDFSGEQFFEMVLFDSNTTGEPKKVLFVIDHVQESNLYDFCPAYEIGQLLKNRLLHTLQNGDSFNFIYHAGDAPHLFSPTWISADSVSFHYALNGLPDMQRVTENGGNPVDIIEESIDFINDNGAEATIFMLTNADVIDDSPTRLNNLAKAMLDNMENTYPMVVVELNDVIRVAFNQNGTRSFNNHFLFSKLANQTQGVFVKRHLIDIETDWWWSFDARLLSLDYVLGQGFDYIQNYYDFVTYNYDFNDGLLYNKHSVVNQSEQRLGDATTIVGQYFGNSSNTIEVEMARSIGGTIYRSRVHIAGSAGAPSIRQLWAGIHLNSLMTPNITPTQKALVVNKSIEYNVLTDFTAFLALEPDSIIMSYNLRDFPLVGVEDMEDNRGLRVLAYPNPFSQHVTLVLHCDESSMGQAYTVTMMDMTGRIIGSEHGHATTNKTKVDLSHHTDSLAPGIYIVRVELGDQVQSIRIVKE